MRRLSSSMTFFYKWVFPVVWLGFVGLAVNSFSSINPRRISPRLRNSTRLGRDIDFIPPGRRRPFRFLGMTRLDPLVEELIDRIDALRRSTR